jgi:4-hydroxy-2-oxoheptanedioate aldolase
MNGSILRRLMAWTHVTLVAGVALAVASLSACGPAPQERPRLNKIIEAIEEGRPAIAGEEWRFIDMEHSPFSAELLVTTLAEMGESRDPDGRLSVTPVVRIPQEGDEDFRWAIKQVLDQGTLGVALTHVDTGEEAWRFVRAMRYPQTLDSAYPEPKGERGWGPGRATRLWRLADDVEYHSKADVWPLNPAGELFAVAMIESVEAVENIHDILAAPISAILMVHSDTSISMGLGPFGDIQTHPEVEAMYQVVLEACKAQDKVMCGAAYARDLHQRRLDEGWQFLLPQG